MNWKQTLSIDLFILATWAVLIDVCAPPTTPATFPGTANIAACCHPVLNQTDGIGREHKTFMGGMLFPPETC